MNPEQIIKLQQEGYNARWFAGCDEFDNPYHMIAESESFHHWNYGFKLACEDEDNMYKFGKLVCL